MNCLCIFGFANLLVSNCPLIDKLSILIELNWLLVLVIDSQFLYSITYIFRYSQMLEEQREKKQEPDAWNPL